MAKSKKKIRRKINPEGSNKMIYAVVVGLIIVFALMFFLFTGKTEKVENKSELMKSTLKYLKNTEGLKDIKYFPENNTVSLYYKGFSQKEKKKKPDYRRVALYAGLKLSNKISNEKITIKLYKFESKEAELILIFKNGKVINRVK